MSTKMPAQGTGRAFEHPDTPPYIMDEVKVLLSDVTTPESAVEFDPQPTTIAAAQRATPATIRNAINPPVWTWNSRGERDAQLVTSSDLGKIGYQKDIDTYFELTDVVPSTWLQVSHPGDASSSFELSTGAADAPSFHDFFSLRIAFEDVWAELLDSDIKALGTQLYAEFDALMDKLRYVEHSGAIDRKRVFSSISPNVISNVDDLKTFLRNLGAVLGVSVPSGNGSVSPAQAGLLTELKDVILKLTHGCDMLLGIAAWAGAGGWSNNNQFKIQTAAANNNNGAFGNDLTSIDHDYPNVTRGQVFDRIRNDLDLISFPPELGSLKALILKITHGCDMLLGIAAWAGAGGWSNNNLFQIQTAATNNNNGAFGNDLTSIDADYRNVTRGAVFNRIRNDLDSISFPTELGALKDVIIKITHGCDMILGVAAWAGAGGWTNNNIFLQQTADNNNNNGAFGNDLTSIDGDYHKVTRGQVFDKIRSDLDSISDSEPSDATKNEKNEKDAKELKQITALFTKLDSMLKERYRFDIFAPASINYGLLLNYRQHWVPQSYQVGDLVSTIPLAPQETRRYTAKTVVKKSRSTKEIEDFLQSGKHESSDTWRIDAEIVEKAKSQTNFQANAKGSGNIGVYKVEGEISASGDKGTDSAQTKRDFHEAVMKAAQEHKNQHRMEISTDESRENETTSYQEIRNPNDELTVTYLFYELQRRYLVDEHLHKVTPVVLVANDVPAPHEIDAAWILRHDWIIKRAILDDSFLPALEYLSTNYTGEEIALQVLEMAVTHQKSVVDKMSQQVQTANQSLDTAATLLQLSQDQAVNDQHDAEIQKQVKAFFDPLGIGQIGAPSDGNSDRARVEFARDTLGRAQTRANQLISELKTELTALQVATDKFTAAANRHFSMLAEIDRLRIHVKDNIIYYMQAIWSYEPSDQRYFRLYDLDVPMFDHNSTLDIQSKAGIQSAIDPYRPKYTIPFSPPIPSDEPWKLHQIANLDNLLGFKGNYMIFPLTNFHNYMAWYLAHPYISFDGNSVVAADPDPYADLTIPQLKEGMAKIYAKDPGSFAANEAYFEEAMFRLLSKQDPEMVIVPSNSLYIEALPGTHPLLEDFKLIHRALDVKKAQAEVRHAELENLRLAARLANGNLADPDIEKKILIETNDRHLAIQADSN